MPKLQVFLPDGTDRVLEMTDERVTIGRMPDNVMQIEDGSVSSYHAEITKVDGQYLLKDLGSTNGTRVEGENISEQKLREGDRVQFGKINAEFLGEARSGHRPMPESSAPSVSAAETSVRPTDFSNASPFKKKRSNMDPVGTAVLAYAGLSIAVFAVAVVLILNLQAPQ